MYIQVKLLNGFKEPLWYEVPATWQQQDLMGSIVRVPLRGRETTALVIKHNISKPNVPFALKAALAIEQFPYDPFYDQYLEQLSSYYQIEALTILKRIRHFLETAAKPEEILVDKEQQITPDIALTQEQQHACKLVDPHIKHPTYFPLLLHGVTGSGKTEVYKQLMQTTIALKKTSLLLLPEVTLALQFEKLLRTQMPSMPIFGFHSATSPKDKKAMWHALLGAQPIIIIGVHLPILLPIPNLGLIIVDEEHEVGYQEKKHPKLNSKEAALIRARACNIPIVLGSATPSLTSLYNVRTRGWHEAALKNRFSGNFPTIQTVFLGEKKQRKNFWISRELETAIKDRLEKKEQSIIFLNRRGYSFFVQCKECSFIFNCTNCSVSLTLHQDNSLACHYCDYTFLLPKICPNCAQPESKFLKKGIGTQQVVAILAKLFPAARIARADLDVTVKKKLWQKTLLDFESGNLDILVGTQTITKGLHFPRVTLVGILWADINLHFPMYNASETALQQLIQVAGRAGRQSKESLVIVQSMADHRVLQFLDERIYQNFYEQEMEFRTLLGYPPCNRLVEIELKNTDEKILESEAQRLVRFFLIQIQQHASTIKVLGPAKPGVAKIKQLHARKIYLKSSNFSALQHLYALIKKSNFKSSIYFTPNPVT